MIEKNDKNKEKKPLKLPLNFIKEEERLMQEPLSTNSN